ncbi:hypothetical protein [Aquabacterium soli]|uniref:hypothetical protein n=1 Tax=Aquabacterium soli TaxID=2493092 RepID=UPI0018F5791D|nr:hypothetical protein [Aquabacterium soli]
MMASGVASTLLSQDQIQALRSIYAGRLVAVCFGAGVDSTAMLVALRAAGIRPDVITFADTGGEKPETMAHLDAMNRILLGWGWPAIDVCRKVPMASTGYADLLGNCLKNETLPSLAFGMKSCSIKWKQGPQDQFLKGAKRGPSTRPPHPLWERSILTGQKIMKLIGYDCGRADVRRSKAIKQSDSDFDYSYPLQVIGWSRPDCVQAITSELGAALVPVKSACFFCPASKHWELYWLAAYHPALLEQALKLERTALTGRHSRFDAVEFGATWEAIVRGADRFPSTTTTVGLGRSFAWNQWARVNDVVNGEFVVHRSAEAVARFVLMSQSLRDADNAFDSRGGKVTQIHSVTKAQQMELTW